MAIKLTLNGAANEWKSLLPKITVAYPAFAKTILNTHFGEEEVQIDTSLVTASLQLDDWWIIATVIRKDIPALKAVWRVSSSESESALRVSVANSLLFFYSADALLSAQKAPKDYHTVTFKVNSNFCFSFFYPPQWTGYMDEWVKFMQKNFTEMEFKHRRCEGCGHKHLEFTVLPYWWRPTLPSRSYELVIASFNLFAHNPTKVSEFAKISII